MGLARSRILLSLAQAVSGHPEPLVQLTQQFHVAKRNHESAGLQVQAGRFAAAAGISTRHQPHVPRYFKGFNDTYGHSAGDSVLRALADLLTRQVRGSDIVCRYGGEEFVVILPDTPPLQVARRAWALCRAARTLPVRHAGQALPAVTILVGVAVYPYQARTSAALLEAADAALYLAKQAGRDQVRLATRPSRPHHRGG